MNCSGYELEPIEYIYIGLVLFAFDYVISTFAGLFNRETFHKIDKQTYFWFVEVSKKVDKILVCTRIQTGDIDLFYPGLKKVDILLFYTRLKRVGIGFGSHEGQKVIKGFDLRMYDKARHRFDLHVS